MDNQGVDLWSDAYDEGVRRSDEADTYPFAGYQRMLETVFHAVSQANAHTLLCIGIGTGLLARKMTDAGMSVVGIDASDNMIAKARGLMPDIQLIRHNIANGLPSALDCQTFDGIVSTYALCHLQDGAKCKLIRALFARLSPGGILAIGDISFETEDSKAACQGEFLDQWNREEHYMVYEKIEKALGLPHTYMQVSHCAGVLILRKPRMILFDYGGTLINESPFHGERGTKALLQHVRENPSALTAREISSLAEKLFADLDILRNTHHVEIHHQIFQRVLYESLGLTFSLTPLEMDYVFFENAAPGHVISGVRPLLNVLRAQRIRTGVISNITFSSEALAMRFRSLIPEHTFELMITSSEYVYRKPNGMLFQIALRKAKLSPEDVWFCGNSFACDVEGAGAVGICPIWFTDDPTETIHPARLKLSNWDSLTACFK